MATSHPEPTSRQTWSADTYERNTRFVSDLGAGVVEWLAPGPGERILDLGCGDGALTVKLVQAGADVVGVDASDNFVEAARKLGLDVRLMDGHALAFEREFDAVFSNAALHWMLRPEAVVSGVARALKPGGRFVAEFGGHMNVAALSTAMRAVGDAMGGDVDIAGPWFYPTEDEYSAMLRAGGFEVEKIARFARPTPLPTGARGWLETMRAPFFDQFGERREEAYDRVLRALKPSLCDRAGNWTADYVRLRFIARLPG
ncbi:Ubiquinone/menaquinone biosynthesis C-methylase UbiE [Faunimonas pinastri]|uniref:Ubiquinone/menaquinone biosynthesis C-methylase UbiE n=1 Tax=Faunimonas pinastri TaxID=1855383 RepID=A0A1H9JKC4_9HYPH|nr:class I SAM-dependent methyltransferase [Faunimonas pinastri]SEQ87286.1 Ubiquinone/menaquinone biosynthesis C-methylase UbiE [Faunimonas pinastri]